MSFPHVFDSTIINEASRCEERFNNQFIENLSLPGESVDLHFGSCFAKGVEVARKSFFYNGRNSDEALCDGLNAAAHHWGSFDEPQGHVKNLANLLLALDGYFDQWKLGEPPVPYDDKALEFTFSFPLGLKHPDDGEDIFYAGKFDMLGRDDTIVYPVDEKTTGKNFFNWSSGWSLWGQFIGYQWACKKLKIPVDRLLVRGIYVGKNDCKYIQHFTSATDIVIKRWHENVIYKIQRLIEQYIEGRFVQAFGTACTMYSPCPYMDLCQATRREDWLTAYHVREPWNPLAKPGGEL